MVLVSEDISFVVTLGFKSVKIIIFLYHIFQNLNDIQYIYETK